MDYHNVDAVVKVAETAKARSTISEMVIEMTSESSSRHSSKDDAALNSPP